MKAVVHDRYGPPRDVLQLKEVPEPRPGTSEVLVRVNAASVNAGDAAVIVGLPYLVRLAYGLTRPRKPIRGSDIAGVVVSVGDDVIDLRPGDEVFGKGEGAFAEMVVAHPESLATKPTAVPFEEAAALPVAGLTALQGLRGAGTGEGDRVLINGASGGVGTFAIQIAKALGAEVTAVCSSGNVDAARSLGAEHVVDYTHHDFTDTDTRYDVLFDNAGSRSLRATRSVIARRGALVLNHGNLDSRWLASLPRMARAKLSSPFASHRTLLNVQTWSRDDLAELARLVEERSVTPVIERTYTLEQVPEAVAYVGQGSARGKVMILTG
jgi:NADPH:quinone reductase-like Zn-dependent oxidoreductase